MLENEVCNITSIIMNGPCPSVVENIWDREQLNSDMKRSLMLIFFSTCYTNHHIPSRLRKLQNRLNFENKNVSMYIMIILPLPT
jgi:hypothetical protein